MATTYTPGGVFGGSSGTSGSTSGGIDNYVDVAEFDITTGILTLTLIDGTTRTAGGFITSTGVTQDQIDMSIADYFAANPERTPLDTLIAINALDIVSNPMGVTLNEGLISPDIARQSALDTEVTARTDADTDLQTQIDGLTRGSVIQHVGQDPANPADGEIWFNTSDEELRYYDGLNDTVVTIAHQADLTAEETARISGDADLLARINAEETARGNADADLQTQIDGLSIPDAVEGIYDYDGVAVARGTDNFVQLPDPDIDDVTGLQTALDAKQDTLTDYTPGVWNAKQDALTDYTPDVWNAKQDALTGLDDVPGLVAELNDKANLDESVQYTDINLDGSDEIVSIDVNGVTRAIASSTVNLGDLTIPVDDQNPALDTDITSRGYVDGAIAAGGGTGVTFDAVPTDGSQNAVRSAGIFTAVNAKQDTLTGTSDVPGLDTALNAKQDANILVTNAEAFRDPNFDPDDYSRGTLIIQEEFGSLLFVDTDGNGDNQWQVTDAHLRNELWEDNDSAGEAPSSPLYDFSTPSRIDNLENDVASNTAGISTIREEFVGEDRLVVATDDDVSMNDYQVYTLRRVEERFGSFTTAPFRVLPTDPSMIAEGDAWYNFNDDVIRYVAAIPDPDDPDPDAFILETRTVAEESGAAIASITGPVATVDGGLMYTATTFDGDPISWTTGGSGTTPTPGTAQFSVSATPHTIVRDETSSANARVTVTLGVSGTGFTYTGFQNAAVFATNGVEYSVSEASSSANTFTSDIGLDDPVSIITFTGQILYDDENDNAQTPHEFSVSVRLVTAATPTDIYFTYAAPDTTVFDLSDFANTGVVAANRAEFFITANTAGGVNDLVIAYPSTLNPIGIFGPFGQYTPAMGEGLQTDITTFTGGDGLSIYTLSGFLTAGLLTFRELS